MKNITKLLIKYKIAAIIIAMVLISGAVYFAAQNVISDSKSNETGDTSNQEKGEDTVTFVKDESTFAAFVMDQFKFIPVTLSE